MVGFLVVLAVLIARVFFSIVLPDNDRLFLSYMIPLAIAPMLVATLLNGSLAIVMAPLIGVLAVFVAFYVEDGAVPLSSSDGAALSGLVSIDVLRMLFTIIVSSITGVLIVHRAERLNRYLAAGLVMSAMSFIILLAFWFIDDARLGKDIPIFLLATSIIISKVTP